MFSTPGGSASRSTSPSRSVASGVYGDGLTTTVLPARSAGANFQAAIDSGKFHGVIAATTPTGRRTTSANTRSSSWMTSRGRSSLAKWRSHRATPLASPMACATGLPCSAVSSGPSSLAAASTASAAASSAPVRAAASVFQLSWALCADSRAASSCSLVHSGA